jgi:predicted RNase H-like HicB family nuclease
VVNWRVVGKNVQLIYEGKAVEDVLHRIESIDKALPKEVVAVILERLYGRFGCYVDRLHRRYVLCDRPAGASCRQRGRLYWCMVEEPWFFSDRPFPGCVQLAEGYLCVRKGVDIALDQLGRGNCGAALAAMPGRRAEVGEWVLYVSDGEVYECDRAVSIYRVRQECRQAERCGGLWKVSKKAVIAYEIIGGRTYVVWQKPALELLKEIYIEEGGELPE